MISPQNPNTNLRQNCGGIPTAINIVKNKNPCEEIKNQRADDNFKNKVTDLRGKTGLKKETGYIQKFGGDYEYKDNANATDNANSLSLPNIETNTYIKGYMHTHVDDYTYYDSAMQRDVIKTGFKIFSPADVSYFMGMLKNAFDNKKPIGDVYSVMVSSQNNYQLRFTGNQFQIKVFPDDQQEDFRKLYANLLKYKIGNSKDLELGFLKFIHEQMNLRNVNLYRMNADGTTTEIKLNADRTDVIETNCPN